MFKVGDLVICLGLFGTRYHEDVKNKVGTIRKIDKFHASPYLIELEEYGKSLEGTNKEDICGPEGHFLWLEEKNLKKVDFQYYIEKELKLQQLFQPKKESNEINRKIYN